MAQYANNMFSPRGFVRGTSRTLPSNSTGWVPPTAGMPTSLTIEGIATYLSGIDSFTYSPANLANMTANDLRYAQNTILGLLA